MKYNDAYALSVLSLMTITSVLFGLWQGSFIAGVFLFWSMISYLVLKGGR